jgi:hypothetical protein
MRRLLLPLALLLATPAMAQPPEQGTTHTFVDPIYGGTVFCDTLAQVREIATAREPLEAYARLFNTANARDEPTCMAMKPTGLVVDVVALGNMDRDARHFHAWAVEARIDATTGYALYLEEFEEIFV